jgi:hypothetical protein
LTHHQLVDIQPSNANTADGQSANRDGANRQGTEGNCT